MSRYRPPVAVAASCYYDAVFDAHPRSRPASSRSHGRSTLMPTTMPLTVDRGLIDLAGVAGPTLFAVTFLSLAAFAPNS